MKVIVSGVPRDLDNAAAWFNDRRLGIVLADLETMIVERESAWGKCTVFVESTIPAVNGNAAQQTDLLIAFADRAALFEIKQNHTKIDNWATQLNRRKDLLARHLSQVRIDPQSVFCFLWTPHANRHALERIFDEVRGPNNHLRHINPTSGRPELCGVMLQAGVPAYLPEAVSARLSTRPRATPLSGCEGIASLLEGLMQRSGAAIGAPPLEFADFSTLRDYLRSGIPQQNIELVLDATHVRGLRRAELVAAHKTLLERRFLEIAGPQGVGKSWFIRELLVDLLAREKQFFPVFFPIMQRKDTVRDVLLELAEEVGVLGDARIDRLDEDGLFDELAAKDVVYCVKDYDRRSLSAMLQLGSKLRQLAHSSRAFWIIESMDSAAPVPASEKGRSNFLRLEPFDVQTLTTIVKKHPPGAAEPDINAVVANAGGIPLLAVWRWTMRDPDQLPKSGRLDKYDLFRYHLKPDERPLLRGLAYILSQSPLGATLRLVEEWCRKTNQFAAHDIRRVAREVIERAHQARLISVELFGSSDLDETENAAVLKQASLQKGGADALVRTLLPSTVHAAHAGWIRVLDPHFVEHFVRDIKADEREKWRKRLEDVLLESVQHDLSLTGVSFSLLAGDPEPFVRSSFRSSSSMIPSVSSWLATREEEGSALALVSVGYFRQWLSWLSDHYWDSADKVRWQLSPPSADSQLELLVYDTVRVRSEFYRNGGECDWGAWERTAISFYEGSNFDLWAEALVRQAQTWLRSPYDDPVRAWTLMRAVLDEEANLSASAGRPLMCFHVLSFLNKTKTLRERLPAVEKDAQRLVPELAEKMVRDGLAMENLNTIANALFFLVRGIEIQNRPVTHEEVVGYLAIMRFVERVSPARRLQAVLTQGTIHRHYCAGARLDWSTFRSHAEQALALYDRVIDVSGKSGMRTHGLSALNYSSAILSQAMRFGEVAGAEDWVGVRYGQALVRMERFVAELASNLRAPLALHDQRLVGNLGQQVAIAKWVTTVLTDATMINELIATFETAANCLYEMTRGIARHERQKPYQQFLTQLGRAVNFTRGAHNQTRALVACWPAVLDVLGEVATALPKDQKARSQSTLRKAAQRVLVHFEGARLVAPAELQTALNPR